MYALVFWPYNNRTNKVVTIRVIVTYFWKTVFFITLFRDGGLVKSGRGTGSHYKFVLVHRFFLVVSHPTKQRDST